MATSRFHLLTYSTLFPNSASPQHGVFVAERLRHLLKTGRIDADIVAPVPWFPFKGKWAGRYGEFARAPECGEFADSRVFYPRYPVIPKFGMNLAPRLMALATKPLVRRLANQQTDIIDAHYFYPDGVAATQLASALGKPAVVTARGSDVNLLTKFRVPREKIVGAASKAAAIVTVSAALKDKLVELGVQASKVHVIRNGVDTVRFHRVDTRRDDESTDAVIRLLIVGNLVAEKGHKLAIDIVAENQKFVLNIVGEGPLRAELMNYAKQQGVEERIRFFGRIGQDELPALYSSADCLLLTSSREGLPNVILESLACGTPVVAADVGGVPEVLTNSTVGRVVKNANSGDFANAIRSLVDSRIPAETVQAFSRQFDWRETSHELLELFDRVKAHHTQSRV